MLELFIPSEIDDYPLTPAEFRLLCRIRRRDGKKEGCYESIGAMSRKTGVSREVVRGALAMLVMLGCVTEERQGNKATTYRYQPRAQWMPPKKAEQFRKNIEKLRKQKSQEARERRHKKKELDQLRKNAGSTEFGIPNSGYRIQLSDLLDSVDRIQ